MRAWLAKQGEKAEFVDLPGPRGDGEVTVDIEYSSVNYKDGLAMRGDRGVVRSPTLVPGIDLVGVVSQSDSPKWSTGDRVIVNGRGIGEHYDGGFAEQARVAADWLVPLPSSLEPHRAAAIGTAGLTAMLAVMAIQSRATGDVLVTGAAGGVGSIAIALLAAHGHRVVASTGRMREVGFLRALGAAEVIDRGELQGEGKPLQSQRWSAAIDVAGGTTLANVLAQTAYGGVVAACGLAEHSALHTTVMPFILRGVTLAGINSVECPGDQRLEAWRRLAAELDPALLDSLTSTIPLADAADAAAQVLEGRVRGRTVISIRS